MIMLELWDQFIVKNFHSNFPDFLTGEWNSLNDNSLIFILLTGLALIFARKQMFYFASTINHSAVYLMNNANGPSFRRPFSKASTNMAIGHQKGAQDLLRVTQHAGRKPFSSMFDLGIYFPHLAQCVRLKKFSYEQVSERVRRDHRLKCAIKQAAEDAVCTSTTNDGRESTNDEIDLRYLGNNSLYATVLKKQEERAENILYDMQSKISDLFLRITSWIMYKLLPCFLSGVVTHTNHIEMLKTAAEKSPGVPLIFLPLHRSHLDYIMVSFILLNNDIRSPIVAAGNNLRIPVFGRLLRLLGAFFIKRKIDPVLGKKDIVYRAILHLYLQHALKAGHNVEFFIEGGRTRTGKPLMPKNGVLSVIVNAFMDGTIPDALLVPVSVNYEKLVDGNFINEQLGKKKEPETFRSAISAIWKIINSKFGLMRIDFNEPFSIRELVESYNEIAKKSGGTEEYKPVQKILQHNQSSSSLYGIDVVCEEHRTLVESISRNIVYDCAAATSVMTTNAIAFIFLTRFRGGASLSDLLEALDNMRRTLSGKRDLGFSGDSGHIVKYACDLLGETLVQKTTDKENCIFKPNIDLPNVIELAYYANSLAPHFALESIVVTALTKLTENSEKDYNFENVVERSLKHCDVLRYEFILSKPTQDLYYRLEATIHDLLAKDIIEYSNTNDLTETQQISNRLAKQLQTENFSDEEDGFDAIENTIRLKEDSQKEQDALISVLAPISHTYSAVAFKLKSLLHGSMIESQFIKYCIQEITRRIQDKECIYAESVSTDSVRNCLKLLEKWGIVEITTQHGVRLLELTADHESHEAVDEIIDQMNALIPNRETSKVS